MNANPAGRRIGDVILKMDNISLAFGGVKALNEVSFDVREHEIRAIIGPNGAGKSTFLRLLAHEEAPDSGRIILHGTDIAGADATAAYQYGMAKSYQINQLFPQFTVRENLRIGALGKQRGRIRFDIFRAADLARRPVRWRGYGRFPAPDECDDRSPRQGRPPHG